MRAIKVKEEKIIIALDESKCTFHSARDTYTREREREWVISFWNRNGHPDFRVNNDVEFGNEVTVRLYSTAFNANRIEEKAKRNSRERSKKENVAVARSLPPVYRFAPNNCSSLTSGYSSQPLNYASIKKVQRENKN